MALSSKQSIANCPQAAGVPGTAQATIAILAIASGWLVCPAASATGVSVMGLFKDKAIVSIDGGKPRTLSVGQAVQGVRLVAADSGSASFEVDGTRRTIFEHYESVDKAIESLPK